MTAGRVVFLVDADNVAVEVIEKALALKQSLHGAVHVKRCYCSADFAVKNLAMLKQLSIRPMVNATAGKNCNDIALAIDAVQLCEREPAAVVVIVGSDSDFAPLVMHLRDRGCRVEGVGQEGKVGAESHLAYDDFISLPVGRGRAAERAPAAAAPRRSSRAPAAAPVKARPPVVAGRRRAMARRRCRGCASGERVELKVAAEALRKEQLLSRNASSTTLFKKHPDWFELAPARQPNSVRYRAHFRAPMKSGPRGAAFTSRPPRRSGRRSYFWAPPSPAGVSLPAFLSASTCALRCSRVLSEAVDGCVVPDAFAGGRDLAGLGVGFGLRLAVGAGLVRGGGRLGGAGLAFAGGSQLAGLGRSGRVGLALVARHRGRGRGLGEGGLGEHGDGRDDGAKGEFGLH